MNTKTMLLGVGALIFGAAVVLPHAVGAYQGDPNVQGPNYSPERHQAMTEAFANKDYAAWQKLMSGKGVTRRINQDNFAQFAQAHELALQGEMEKANAIRAELGLGQRSGTGRGQGGYMSQTR